MSGQQQVMLGARVPADIKEKLYNYCLNHGIKMNFFVAEAIKEKLLEKAEDEQDLVVAGERLKNAEFISREEIKKYASKRGIKR